jgi:hypothetical protein
MLVPRMLEPILFWPFALMSENGMVRHKIAVIGIDIGKNSFHIVGHNQRGAIVVTRLGGNTARQTCHRA